MLQATSELEDEIDCSLTKISVKLNFSFSPTFRLGLVLRHLSGTISMVSKLTLTQQTSFRVAFWCWRRGLPYAGGVSCLLVVCLGVKS